MNKKSQVQTPSLVTWFGSIPAVDSRSNRMFLLLGHPNQKDQNFSVRLASNLVQSILFDTLGEGCNPRMEMEGWLSSAASWAEVLMAVDGGGDGDSGW